MFDKQYRFFSSNLLRVFFYVISPRRVKCFLYQPSEHIWTIIWAEIYNRLRTRKSIMKPCDLLPLLLTVCWAV